MVVWLLYDIAWRVMSRVVESGRLRQEVAMLRMEERRLADIRSYVEETRTLRHDFRHHLLALRGMHEEGKSEELGARPQLCANAAVDAMAAHYDAIAREKGVRVSWRLDLPVDLPVAEADFCSMLGNLVENAVTAASELPGESRWVEVVAQEITSQALGLSVRNPYAGTLRFGRNGLPRTDRPGHGVGLASVAATAEKYNGGIDAHAEGDVLTIGAVLYHGQ